LFLRHNAVHQRVHGGNDGEVYAAKKDEPEQLNEFATPQLETKSGWNEQIPCREHRQDDGADAWPETTDERHDDDRREEGNERNFSADIVAHGPTRKRRESDEANCNRVTGIDAAG
jgi:hypothetical protein